MDQELAPIFKNFQKNVSVFIESKLDQVSQDQKKYYHEQAETWEVTRKSLEDQLSEKDSHIRLLEERVSKFQEEMGNLKKVSYIQAITKQMEEKNQELDLLQKRFEKSQQLNKQLKQSNDLLNIQAEKGSSEQHIITAVEEVVVEKVKDESNLTTYHRVEKDETETTQVIEKGDTTKETSNNDNNTANDTTKDTTTNDTQVEKEKETNIATKSQVKGSQQNNSNTNTITWDGTEYSVREKKIRRNLYWVVTKVPKDDERWIFSKEEGVTSPVGKVDSQKKCHFFL